MWQGDYLFLIKQLVAKDFKIRYRNMSLGVFWSLLNPIIYVALFSYLFTEVFRSSVPNYALYVLVGLLPYNFFANAWGGATSSVLDNAGLIKRVPIPREIVPIATVLSALIHLGIQFMLLIVAVYYYGLSIHLNWLWLIPIWGLEVVFVFGISMATSGLYVIMRDIRYLVESLVLILFFLVPIFYSFEMIPMAYKDLYQYNPITALVLASRVVILDGQTPPTTLMVKLVLVSVGSLVAGSALFRFLQPRFYRYL